METLTALLALLTGFLIRLAIPILLTTILVFFLHKLDARWQADAQLQNQPSQKPACWQIKDCPIEQRANCIGANSALPCWQAFRLPNGYLHEECLTCKVFTEAPLRTLQTETRRM